jgi:predicted O-methyltransferase YrrM
VNDWLDRRWYNDPLAKGPNGTPEEYQALADFAAKQVYPEVERIEQETGFALDREFNNALMLPTLMVKKRHLPPRPFHGRLLYSLVRDYIARNQPSFVNIVETGTARGFSALCMAKAIVDSGVPGHVTTIDVLPHLTPMFWNTIVDCDGTRKTRRDILEPWGDLCDRVTFLQGDTLDQLGRLGMRRINFAFLDAQHSRPDVLHEFRAIAPLQSKGDMVYFDDVIPGQFPGVVAAVEQIEAAGSYTVQHFTEINHGIVWMTRR